MTSDEARFWYLWEGFARTILPDKVSPKLAELLQLAFFSGGFAAVSIVAGDREFRQYLLDHSRTMAHAVSEPPTPTLH